MYNYNWSTLGVNPLQDGRHIYMTWANTNMALTEPILQILLMILLKYEEVVESYS